MPPKSAKRSAISEGRGDLLERDEPGRGESAASPVAHIISVSITPEFRCGQRVVTAWATIPNASRRILAPSRESMDRAEVDKELVAALAGAGFAGESIASKWRAQEINDKEAAKMLKDAPADQKLPYGAAGTPGEGKGRGRGRGRGKGKGRGRRSVDVEEEIAFESDEEGEVFKRPAARGGRGAGRARGRAKGRGRGRKRIEVDDPSEPVHDLDMDCDDEGIPQESAPAFGSTPLAMANSQERQSRGREAASEGGEEGEVFKRPAARGGRGAGRARGRAKGRGRGRKRIEVDDPSEPVQDLDMDCDEEGTVQEPAPAFESTPLAMANGQEPKSREREIASEGGEEGEVFKRPAARGGRGAGRARGRAKGQGRGRKRIEVDDPSESVHDLDMDCDEEGTPQEAAPAFESTPSAMANRQERQSRGRGRNRGTGRSRGRGRSGGRGRSRGSGRKDSSETPAEGRGRGRGRPRGKAQSTEKIVERGRDKKRPRGKTQSTERTLDMRDEASEAEVVEIINCEDGPVGAVGKRTRPGLGTQRKIDEFTRSRPVWKRLRLSGEVEPEEV